MTRKEIEAALRRVDAPDPPDGLLERCLAAVASARDSAPPRRKVVWAMLTSAVPLLLALTMAATASFFAYILSRPMSPEDVCRRTIAALESQDASTLVALADPEELRKLNITEAKVRALLNETLWSRGGYTGPHRWVEHTQSSSSTVRRYDVDEASVAASEAQGLIKVYVVAARSDEWRLNLSALLYFACFHSTSGDVNTARASWKGLVTKHDIRGVRRTNDGSYVLWSDPRRTEP